MSYFLRKDASGCWLAIRSAEGIYIASYILGGSLLNYQHLYKSIFDLGLLLTIVKPTLAFLEVYIALVEFYIRIKL